MFFAHLLLIVIFFRLFFDELIGVKNIFGFPGRQDGSDIGHRACFSRRRFRGFQDHFVREIPASPVAQTFSVPIVDAAGNTCRSEYLTCKFLFSCFAFHIGYDTFGRNDAQRYEFSDKFVHFFKGFAFTAETIFCEL